MTPIQTWKLVLAATAFVASPPVSSGGDVSLVWPNSESRANSDPWLARRHDEIRQMRPKVLVLNFVNGLPVAEARDQAGRLADVLREGSRYHGYSKPDAPAFLDYQIFKVADLADLGRAGRLPRTNSSLYPRVPNWKGGDFGNFLYGELFGERFARLYGVPDPDHPGGWLNLKSLVDRGLVHEVWMICIHEKTGGPFESTEVKQVYDGQFTKVPGRWVQAGNGGSPDQPFIGRSLRIVFLNAERGPGSRLGESEPFDGGHGKLRRGSVFQPLLQ